MQGRVRTLKNVQQEKREKENVRRSWIRYFRPRMIDKLTLKNNSLSTSIHYIEFNLMVTHITVFEGYNHRIRKYIHTQSRHHLHLKAT